MPVLAATTGPTGTATQPKSKAHHPPASPSLSEGAAPAGGVQEKAAVASPPLATVHSVAGSLDPPPPWLRPHAALLATEQQAAPLLIRPSGTAPVSSSAPVLGATALKPARPEATPTVESRTSADPDIGFGLQIPLSLLGGVEEHPLNGAVGVVLPPPPGAKLDGASRPAPRTTPGHPSRTPAASSSGADVNPSPVVLSAPSTPAVIVSQPKATGPPMLAASTVTTTPEPTVASTAGPTASTSARALAAGTPTINGRSGAHRVMSYSAAAAVRKVRFGRERERKRERERETERDRERDGGREKKKRRERQRD